MDYNSLIERSNQINAEKVELNRLLSKGKSAIQKGRKRIDIRERLKELSAEHEKVIEQINMAHGDGSKSSEESVF